MGQIGYRPKGETAPMYHTERDFAYITPTLMRIAIESLENKNDFLRNNWRIEKNVSQAIVAKAAESIARAQADFVNAVDPPKSFKIALERHGFYNFNFDVQQYVLAAIGEVVCAAWFFAVREVSIVGQASPAAVDMARFTAAVRDFCLNSDTPMYEPEYVAEYRAMENRDLRTRLQMLESQLNNSYAENKKLQQQLSQQAEQQKPASCCSGLLRDLTARLKSFFGPRATKG